MVDNLKYFEKNISFLSQNWFRLMLPVGLMTSGKSSAIGISRRIRMFPPAEAPFFIMNRMSIGSSTSIDLYACASRI